MPHDPPFIEKPKTSRARRLMQAMLWLIVIFLILLPIGASCGCGDDGGSQITATEAQMGTLRLALTLYQKRNGFLPSTGEGLQALAISSAKASFQKPLIAQDGILDPWGSPYQYRTPAKDSDQDFDLWSLGPDKKNKTEDDIPGFNDR